MGDQLNAGAEDGRRSLDIPTIGLFTLVTSTGLIGVPLFGYVRLYAAGLGLGRRALSHEWTGHYRGGTIG
jgi:hypothetical protein